MVQADGRKVDKPLKISEKSTKIDRLGRNLLGLIRAAFCHCNLLVGVTIGNVK